MNYVTLRDLLQKSMKYDINKTINIIFYIRDARNGKGYRDVGRLCYQWLLFNYPDILKEVLHYIPNVGRWDDMYSVFPRRTFEINELWVEQNNLEKPTREHLLKIIECQQTAVQIYIERLKEDLENIDKNEIVSLASKWAVTEKSSLNRKFKFVNVTCNQWGITRKTYRQYISKIRNYANNIERLLTEKRYDEIKFSRIPKLALMKYKEVLLKVNYEKFIIYLTFLKLKQDILDTKPYSPFDMVLQYNRILKDGIETEPMEIVESEWDKIIIMALTKNIFKKTLCVIDTTGSMYQHKISNIYVDSKVAINIGVAFAILVARCADKPFNNTIMNYSEDPKYIYLRRDEILLDSLQKIINFETSTKSNLKKIYDKILETVNFNEKQGMLEQIIIFSDKPFTESYNDHINVINDVNEKYSIYGFKVPNILYFNINVDDIIFNNYDTKYNKITEVNGFSYDIFDILYKNGEFTINSLINNISTKYFKKYSQ